MENIADIMRERFVLLNQEYASYSGGKVYPEHSKLRIEVPLVAGVGRYQFDIKKTNITNSREQALDRNDVFVPNFMGLFLSLQSTTKPATEVLRSFPAINDGANPSGYAAGFQNDDAEAIYNGKLVWLVDNGVLFNAYPTERFKRVPRTQSGFVLDSNDAAVVESVKPNWDIVSACDVVIPKLTIAGTRDHNITVNFDAQGLTFPVTTGFVPVLVLYMDGYLIKGGCEYYDGKNPNARAVGQW